MIWRIKIYIYIYRDSLEPFSNALFSEGQRERSKVGNKRRSNEHIAEQIVVDSLKISGRLGPSLLLAA